MDSKQLRKLFLDFMSSKGCSILPSASLLPKEDPTLLFVNSGMYPLVPYLMGADHPNGTRLTDSQKCIRTLDIEEVGDNRHLSFFEMLGFWSLGDFFKREAITWTFEFLTSKDYLGLNPERIYPTVYKGSDGMEADEESIAIWKEAFAEVGIQADVGEEFNFKKAEEKSSADKYVYRITKKSGKDNWWSLPYRGPCGPCSEVNYLLDKHDLNFADQFNNMDLVEISKFIDNELVEIWNNVFMQFEGERNEDEEPINLQPLAKRNVDTGVGFERLLAVINKVDTVHEIDCIRPISLVAEKWSRK